MCPAACAPSHSTSSISSTEALPTGSWAGVFSKVHAVSPVVSDRPLSFFAGASSHKGSQVALLRGARAGIMRRLCVPIPDWWQRHCHF